MTNATPRLPNRLDSTNATVFASPVISGQVFTLHFSTYPGKHYRVEFSEDLGLGQWTTVGADFLATEKSTAAIDGVIGRNQRFYRVVQLD
jgi:hypothetical protein